jgi:hypothetical protein
MACTTGLVCLYGTVIGRSQKNGGKAENALEDMVLVAGT